MSKLNGILNGLLKVGVFALMLLTGWVLLRFVPNEPAADPQPKPIPAKFGVKLRMDESSIARDVLAGVEGHYYDAVKKHEELTQQLSEAKQNQLQAEMMLSTFQWIDYGTASEAVKSNLSNRRDVLVFEASDAAAEYERLLRLSKIKEQEILARLEAVIAQQVKYYTLDSPLEAD